MGASSAREQRSRRSSKFKRTPRLVRDAKSARIHLFAKASRLKMSVSSDITFALQTTVSRGPHLIQAIYKQRRIGRWFPPACATEPRSAQEQSSCAGLPLASGQ